ncbi:TetR/AcrR family transcriptional regulator [Cytobacillus sp. T106]|uniref:TetR/AcrR family transcriptional regulator n=1 Tax=Bacillus infantis TaxID=324767 RepID=A0A5D4SNG2_9BACI|nr:TetR/AcrR family transcriptional regulator [Bacillus infantis]OXT18327.1 hypothetical protein B9K06_07450 [Bacillus sp. OG2]PLR74931.1 TetR/AcrR family transcriptional regulator [Bacillus sp. UMB0728]MCK6208039.1 TetR/AcrR family transcriptional regulator [Bacillus infantis]MDW2877931.1 TetR/AcrR family transcriptional regulator [Bacillus infantis]RYI29399.1 TetR/AcrR family transcriptional regulator [Bacillus infantis]
MNLEGKRKTRESILCAASNLFKCQGYNGTGLNQIIEVSGAPKGSIYYHFPGGKEEIAVEAVKHVGNEIKTMIKKELASSEDAAAAFRYHAEKIASYFDVPLSHENSGLHIGLIASETALTSEPIRQACQETYKEWQSLYKEKLLLSGFSEERSKELALLVSSMIEGAVMLSNTYGNGKPLRNIAEHFTYVFRVQ